MDGAKKEAIDECYRMMGRPTEWVMVLASQMLDGTRSSSLEYRYIVALELRRRAEAMQTRAGLRVETPVVGKSGYEIGEGND